MRCPPDPNPNRQLVLTLVSERPWLVLPANDTAAIAAARRAVRRAADAPPAAR
jgi:hypothetical protein